MPFDPYDSHTWWLFDSRESSGKTCPVCLGLHMTHYRGDTIQSAFPYHKPYLPNKMKAKVHPHCLLPDTLVKTFEGYKPINTIVVGDLVLTHKGRYKPVIQVHKNRYKGSIYKLQDSWLTGNHPVLTKRGWVPASQLDKLDCLINVIVEPVNTPTVSNQIGIFSSVLLDFSGATMPVSAVNLYGDSSAWNSKIYVEDVNGIQWNNVNSSFFERFKEHLFKVTKFLRRLNTFSTFHKKIVRLASTSNIIMRCLNLERSLGLRHVAPLQSFSFTLGSPSYSSSFEATTNSNSTYFEVFSDTVFAPTLNSVQSYNFGDWQFYPQRSFTQQQTPVTDIDNILYKGFVYNLTVADDESYCIGKHNLAVHNCRCLLVWTGTTKSVMDNPYGILKRPAQKAELPDKVAGKTLKLSPSQQRLWKRTSSHAKETFRGKHR